MKVNEDILAFFRNCFTTAEQIAAESNLELTHGTIDLPGLNDIKETVVHFPILKSPEKTLEDKFTISFATRTDFSPYLDSKFIDPTDGDFKKPWLRFSIFLNENSDMIPFRISVMENNFINKFKKNISFITGIKSLKETHDKIYTAQFTPAFEHIGKLKDFQNVIDEMGKIETMKMLRADSQQVIFDIECPDEAAYTKEAILDYIKTTNEISNNIQKLSNEIVNDMT